MLALASIPMYTVTFEDSVPMQSAFPSAGDGLDFRVLAKLSTRSLPPAPAPTSPFPPPCNLRRYKGWWSLPRCLFGVTLNASLSAPFRGVSEHLERLRREGGGLVILPVGKGSSGVF